MTKVLFVCLGNICRSPMAEAIYKAEITKRKLDWQIDSAATSSWEVGHSAHPGTKKRLRQAGLSRRFRRDLSTATRRNSFLARGYFF